jgi:hypothetical protein
LEKTEILATAALVAGMRTTSKGILEAYRKSSELLVVINSEQFNGWQQLHDSYVHGHPGTTEMGFIQPNPHSSAATQRTSLSL